MLGSHQNHSVDVAAIQTQRLVQQIETDHIHASNCDCLCYESYLVLSSFGNGFVKQEFAEQLVSTVNIWKAHSNRHNAYIVCHTDEMASLT